MTKHENALCLFIRLDQDVEDMFYNAPTRLKAMKSAGDEYGRVLQVVQSYAVDNEGVAVVAEGDSTATATGI